MKPCTEEYYQQRIGRVLSAILADPGADHGVESLASVAALSPFHFHRVYRAMTGEGVAETVRRLRLAQAARALGESGDSVTNIAIDAGYDNVPAFARAFRRFAGTSPSAFQADRKMLAEGVAAVRLQRVAPLLLLTLRHPGGVETIGQTHRRLAARLGARGAASRVGLSVGDPEGGDPFIYHVGVAAGDDVAPVPGLEAMAVPGGLYAAYRHIGSYGLLPSAYRLLFGGWLARSGYRLDAARPALEFYRSPWNWGDRADCVTELLIPIQEP